MKSRRRVIGCVSIVLTILGGLQASAQSRDPMRPPPERLSQMTIPDNSLAAAIMTAQQGGPALAELVNVLKSQQGQLSAVLDAAGMSAGGVADLQKATEAEQSEKGLVVRSPAGERTLSPNPLVRKTPRPVGSPPSRAASETSKPFGDRP